MPFHLADEPENLPLAISEDENVGPTFNLPSSPTERLFAQGFESKEEEFGFVSEEPPLATLLMSPVALSTAPATTPAAIPVIVPRDEAKPCSGRSMKQFIIEVPEGMNLLKKPNRSTISLKPLIGPLERETLKCHSSITLMNDAIYSTLKLYSSSLTSFTYLFFKFLTLSHCFFIDQFNRHRADEENCLD